MALDVRGSLKNVKLNNNIYMFADELFANAIDAFLIRREKQKDVVDLKIKFISEISTSSLDDSRKELTITCIDNGIGLGDDQTKAFVTQFTSYKDDLNIKGIGECKGSGRIQYLLYFSRMKIESIFKVADSFTYKKLDFSDDSSKEISEDSFDSQSTSKTEVGFKITLSGLKDNPRENILKRGAIETLYSAQKLKSHILVFFLQRLITLKDQLGAFEVKFESSFNGSKSVETIVHSDLPSITAERFAKFLNPDTQKETVFKISHYKLSVTDYQIAKNTVALCAKSTIVDDITGKYLKGKTQENNPLNSNYHIILVESEFLDTHVNEQRDGFDLPRNATDREQTFSLLGAEVSLEEIYEVINDTVVQMLSPPDWNKEKLIENVASKYGVSSTMIVESEIRMNANDTEESVVTRVLQKYNDKIMKDTSEIFNMKSEISKLDPESDNFRDKVNEIAWKHTSTLKKIDMVNLSQLVVRRAAIIDVLRLAVTQELKIQKERRDKGNRENNESLIHNIFFPMRRDSTEISDHDIWILNEEYNYFDYISSDKNLSSMQLDHSSFFDSDIDSKLEEILNKKSKDNERKRPDIAIFKKNGAAIIVEFKAPGISLDDHVGDLMEYAQLLAAKSNGKLKQFYGYLIGDTVNPNRILSFKKFSNNKGWFSTLDVVEQESQKKIGELYAEILYYNDIADKASMKLEVYKKKLGLN